MCAVCVVMHFLRLFVVAFDKHYENAFGISNATALWAERSLYKMENLGTSELISKAYDITKIALRCG